MAGIAATLAFLIWQASQQHSQRHDGGVPPAYQIYSMVVVMGSGVVLHAATAFHHRRRERRVQAQALLSPCGSFAVGDPFAGDPLSPVGLGGLEGCESPAGGDGGDAPEGADEASQPLNGSGTLLPGARDRAKRDGVTKREGIALSDQLTRAADALVSRTVASSIGRGRGDQSGNYHKIGLLDHSTHE